MKKMSPDLNSKYWNERYLKDDFGWDLGSISTPLKDYFNQLNNKDLKILIPGAGNAHEAEYLINKGFTNVFVCDIAPEALNNLKKRCPAFKVENLLLRDFFEIQTSTSLSLTFDLIIEQTFFCAIDPSLRQKYFENMYKLLKPNGKLVGLLFNDSLNTDQPPFGGNKEEYLNYFKNLFSIKTYETAYNSVKPREGRELFINLIKKDH
jgi:methyl halide transferase